MREVARLLDTGVPTKSRYESACRHGLRAMLCMQGEKWQRADNLAASIVELALHRIGVSRRPTWNDGQPAPELRKYFYCQCCGGKMVEGSSRPYCSAECSSVMKHRRWRDYGAQDELYSQRAAQIAMTGGHVEHQPLSLRLCGECNKLFQPIPRPLELRQIYCSRTCASNAGKKALRACPVCTTPFSPKHAGQINCSEACTVKAKQQLRRAHLGPRPCAICGTSFEPVHSGQLYCGKTCLYEAKQAQRGYVARLGDARDCLICNTPFRPTAAMNAKYCSKDCIAEATRRSHRDRRAKLKVWHEHECRICANPFKSTNPHQVICGADACVREHQRRRAYAKFERRKERERQAAAEPEPAEDAPAPVLELAA